MGDVTGETLIYLILAGVIGFVVGWLSKRVQSRMTEKTLVQDLKQTHDKLDAAEGQLRRQEALIGDLRNEIDARTQETKTRTDELAAVGDKLKTSEATVDRLEAELSQLRDDKELEIRNLREHIGTLEPLQGQLEESQAGRNRLQGELQDLKDRIQTDAKRLKDELSVVTAEKAKEIDTLKAELAEQKTARSELMDKDSDVDRLQREKPSLAARKDARLEEEAKAVEALPDGKLYRPPAERDDLKKIKGIGPVLEKTLNRLGVCSYAQIGRFTAEDIERVSSALEVFPGRIARDDWIGGAREAYQEKYGKQLD